MYKAVLVSLVHYCTQRWRFSGGWFVYAGRGVKIIRFDHHPVKYTTWCLSLLIGDLKKRYGLTQNQFSRYISTPSTTTATSNSDLEPPSAPPPPPPLNIGPSRARRQLAARLALHSKQNTEMNTDNGDRVEEYEHRKSLNPFADADDSDEDDEDVSFEIGDLEDDLGLNLNGEGEGIIGGSRQTHVGVPDLASVLSSLSAGASSPPPTLNTSVAGIGRASFPSMWPFGARRAGEYHDNNRETVHVGFKPPKAYIHNRRDLDGDEDVDTDLDLFADDDDLQSPEADDDSENSSDEEAFEGVDGGAAGDGGERGREPIRSLSSTTEAKRRTSLEDDDEDEEVVHVAMEEVEREKSAGVGGEAELVEAESEKEK